ncbi:MAG TPA: hypothetical protein VG734_14585 [Lacunisphaera sp.]|nr:hypothetical protein [Lacunisphaera sp.]
MSSVRDKRLLGRWRLASGVRLPEYLEQLTVEFSADGTLTYRYLHDGEPTSISRSYEANGGMLSAGGSAGGQEGNTGYQFADDGSLVFDDGTRYRRMEDF